MKSFLIIFMFFPLLGFSQLRWTNSYHENESVNSVYIIESYDEGYILFIKLHESLHYGWMIKTDINGQIIWEKRIGDDNSYGNIYHLTSNSNGDIFLAGYTNYYNEL